jgi:hypothetical protein
MTDYGSFADDFFVNLNLQTTLALPSGRETVLHFFEAVQKEFPEMTSFFQRETGEYTLEGQRDSGNYRWIELSPHRLAAGFFNPPSPAEAYRLHTWLLDRSVYYLGVSGLDVECLDVMFGWNMDFRGNRDAIVGQALLGGSPLASLAGEGNVKLLECEPSMVISLDEECYVQARLSMETRSNSFQVRTGQYDEEPISVYFTVRRYPRPGHVIKLKEHFTQQCKSCEDLVSRVVLPQIISPISQAISSAE